MERNTQSNPFGNFSDEPLVVELDRNKPGPSRVASAQKQVDQVLEIMKTNVDKVLERENNLDALNERAHNLESSSDQFVQSSQQLRRRMCCSNAKMILAAFFIIAILVLAMVAIFHVDWEPNDNSNHTTTVDYTITTTLPN